MNWEEQLNGISIGTLFKFLGKTLAAGILWVYVLYVLLLIPVGITMLVMVSIADKLGW